MKQKIKIEITVGLAIAECQIFARYWEDSEINGVEDDANNPKMPCVESVEHFYYGEKILAWCPIIDLDNGRILNWSRGYVTKIHYKSCDENVVVIKDLNGEVVKHYTGYVPRFLDPYRDGYGDYVIMEIDSNGYIRDFDNCLDDIFDDEED